MEYQGIITGIGDKESGKNLIQPQHDAIINKFIIGKNTILEGLELNANILSAGSCILCGYRGIIEESKNLNTTAYVYGRFTIYFDKDTEDTFEIETSTIAKSTNVNPTEITSAGTYYVLLYANGEKKVDSNKYPEISQYSVETDKVLDGAVISPNATTPTDLTKNELDEDIIATDLHLTQPNRVANTEYVHAQIEREIDYGIENINISEGNKDYILTFEKKANYVIISYNIKIEQGVPIKENFNVPEKFIPKSDRKIILYLKGFTNNTYYVYGLTVKSTGLAIIDDGVGMTDSFLPSYTTLFTGYKI